MKYFRFIFKHFIYTMFGNKKTIENNNYKNILK